MVHLFGNTEKQRIVDLLVALYSCECSRRYHT
jgi:hypothetical protein